jgi:hypothetical protein
VSIGMSMPVSLTSGIGYYISEHQEEFASCVLESPYSFSSRCLLLFSSRCAVHTAEASVALMISDSNGLIWRKTFWQAARVQAAPSEPTRTATPVKTEGLRLATAGAAVEERAHRTRVRARREVGDEARISTL